MNEHLRAPDTQDAASGGEGPGTYVGPYRILQPIGEGGFGAVFEAEQTHPVKRRVALKLIKLGMDTRDVLARFEAERQALALMDHPNIARVLDAGATETGRPYFVMELVKGEPISSYCDKHNLSIRERLELFAQVCAAVQHAHTKGVIHRDIKPSNILVSTLEDRPFAKVIDFGIAKAISGRLTDMTLFTAQQQLIGTPMYMSPEQAEGSADIDTRTDIYSLGVLLYKLLTDSTPYENVSQRFAGSADFKRVICEADPPTPSACLAQSTATLAEVAKRRDTDAARLTRTIRGELDWIVMKAIEKERARRYETANGLAMDVRRYLAGQPVHAAPPSATYRLKKFVRRHKGAAAASAAATIALLAGIVAFAIQARIAQARARELEQVSRFQADMLYQVDVTEAGKLLSADVKEKLETALVKQGLSAQERSARIAAFAALWQNVNATDAARDLIDRTILNPAISAIDKQFKDQPLVDATLRQVLAVRYIDMGMFDAALPLQQRALETRRRVLGDDHPDTLEALNNMGALLLYQGKLAEAERFMREAMEGRRRVRGEDNPETLTAINNFGMLLRSEGKLSEAERYLRESMEKRRRVLGNDDRDTLTSINNLGIVIKDQGRDSEAEPYYREALDARRRVLGQDHPDTLSSMNNMGFLLQKQGKFAEAEPFYREAAEKSRRVLGEEHPNTLNSIGNLGRLLKAQGKLSEAEPLLREALEKQHRVLGDDHPDTLRSIADAGDLLRAQGKPAEASALLEPAAPAVRKAFTTSHPDRLASFLKTLGETKIALEQFEAAEANLIEAHGIYAKTPGPKPADPRDCMQDIVDLYTAWHAMQPDRGYDAKAAEWRRKLAALSDINPKP